MYYDEIPHGSGIRMGRPYRWFPGTPKARPLVYDLRFAVDVAFSYTEANVVMAYRHYRDGTVQMVTYAEFWAATLDTPQGSRTFKSLNAWDVINEVGP